jgi:hypothetical protein
MMIEGFFLTIGGGGYLEEAHGTETAPLAVTTSLLFALLNLSVAEVGIHD